MRTTTGSNQRCLDISRGANRFITNRVLFVPVTFLSSIAWVLALSVTNTWADTSGSEVAAEKPGHTIQTQCPVMVGNKIDPSIYSDYQGKRVFFCCQNCKAAFAKAPEKYLLHLPQFASAQADATQEEHEHADHAHEFSLTSLAEPTGILTLSLVASTVCLGLLRRVRRLRPRLLLKLHKIAGICALGSGALHATIVLLIH